MEKVSAAAILAAMPSDVVTTESAIQGIIDAKTDWIRSLESNENAAHYIAISIKMAAMMKKNHGKKWGPVDIIGWCLATTEQRKAATNPENWKGIVSNASKTSALLLLNQ